MFPSQHLRSRREGRRGTVLVVCLFVFTLLGVCLVFAADLGNVRMVQAELQNAADGAALTLLNSNEEDPALLLESARQVALRNHPNDYEGSLLLSDADVERGIWDRDQRTFTPVTPPNTGNAVRVTVRRSAERGNAVSMSFARMIGATERFDISASAVATISNDWQIIARNKLQIGDDCKFQDVGAYGRYRVELGGGCEVNGDGRIGSLPGSVVQYSRTRGLPEKLVRDDVVPKLADNIVSIIDDIEHGIGIPDQITQVRTVSSWPPSGGIQNHTAYIVNGPVDMKNKTVLRLQNVIIAARGTIHIGEESGIVNTGVPGHDLSTSLLSTGDIQIGEKSVVDGVDLVAKHDIQIGRGLGAFSIGTIQAANDIQLGEAPTLSGFGTPSQSPPALVQ